MSDLQEQLASAAHEGWRKQYKLLGRHDKDYLNVPYAELSEEWKDYDRVTTDAMLPIVAEKLAGLRAQHGRLVCHFCSSGAPLQGRQHRLESNNEAGFYLVDCAAWPIYSAPDAQADAGVCAIEERVRADAVPFSNAYILKLEAQLGEIPKLQKKLADAERRVLEKAAGAVQDEITTSTGPTGGWLDSPKAIAAAITKRLKEQP